MLRGFDSRRLDIQHSQWSNPTRRPSRQTLRPLHEAPVEQPVQRRDDTFGAYVAQKLASNDVADPDDRKPGCKAGDNAGRA